MLKAALCIPSILIKNKKTYYVENVTQANPSTSFAKTVNVKFHFVSTKAFSDRSRDPKKTFVLYSVMHFCFEIFLEGKTRAA